MVCSPMGKYGLVQTALPPLRYLGIRSPPKTPLTVAVAGAVAGAVAVAGAGAGAGAEAGAVAIVNF